jgi:signal transduction histidine kinase
MRFVLKIIHNEHIAVLWAFLVELVVHGLFAMQAFLLGGFLGDVALSVVFGKELGTQIGAWSLAIFVFGAAFVSFVLGDYLKEHVFAYVWSGKGDDAYIQALKETTRMAVGLELTSLAFRVLIVAIHDNDLASAAIILVAGCIGLRYAIKMAKVIHASVNRPISHDLAKSQHQAGQHLAERAMKYTRNMSPEQLARWADGDSSALQEVAESGFFAEEQRHAKKGRKLSQKETNELNRSQQEEEMRQRQRIAEDGAHNLLSPKNWKRNRTFDPVLKVEPEHFPEAQASNQAGRLSQNGRH